MSSSRENIESTGLNPSYVTGFADGEGCFRIDIHKNSKLKSGWEVILSFSINLHIKDKSLLERIRLYFGKGQINEAKGKNSCILQIRSIKDLIVVIDHFNKYPLISQKHADYLIFLSAYEIIKSKNHLTPEGLNTLLELKSSSNLGLPAELKSYHSDIVPAIRPLISKSEIIDPNWLVGFVEGEGNFLIKISKSNTTKLGYQVLLVFQIGLHSRDSLLLKNLVEYLGCGTFREYPEKSVCYFTISSYNDIVTKLIPMFDKYPLQGAKYQDFIEFKQVAELMQNKAHLTEKG